MHRISGDFYISVDIVLYGGFLLTNNKLQSYFTLEDIAHTMNIQKEHTSQDESLHDELKNTKGKILMKSKMNINKGEKYPHPLVEYLISTNLFIWKDEFVHFNVDQYIMNYVYPLTFWKTLSVC